MAEGVTLIQLTLSDTTYDTLNHDGTDTNNHSASLQQHPPPPLKISFEARQEVKVALDVRLSHCGQCFRAVSSRNAAVGSIFWASESRMAKFPENALFS